MTPTIFLRIIDGRLFVWNYLSHEQFEISKHHLDRILKITGGDAFTPSNIDKDIAASGCLSHLEPASWGWDCLSRIFHVGTQIGLGAAQDLPDEDSYRGYIKYCASLADKIPALHTELPGETLDLPPPVLDKLQNIDLWEALRARKTTRCFDAEYLSLSDVATILWATFGAIHGPTRLDLHEQGLMPVGYRRSSPSGGSLQPSEAYLVSLRVDGLAQGIYHYRSHKHQLTFMGEKFPLHKLGSYLCSQNLANDLSFGIFISSRFDKLWWKYPHSRAYRVALLDIGCLVQTFQLSCTALKVASWPTGYFFDHQINEALGFDTDKESVMFFLGGGKGSGSIAKSALLEIKRGEAKAATCGS